MDLSEDAAYINSKQHFPAFAFGRLKKKKLSRFFILIGYKLLVVVDVYRIKTDKPIKSIQILFIILTKELSFCHKL